VIEKIVGVIIEFGGGLPDGQVFETLIRGHEVGGKAAGFGI
jgi:hypothetical protein